MKDHRVSVRKKCRRTGGRRVALETDHFQVRAILERKCLDVGDAAAYMGAGQVGTTIERILPNAGDTVGNEDFR